MTVKLASIEIIKNIRKHPNADKLDIANVLGYQVIVGRDEFKEGQYVVFIQPDSILPEGISKYAPHLKDLEGKRVRSIKLRKEFSFGVVIGLYQTWNSDINCTSGFDMTKIMGIKKYEAPVKPGTQEGTKPGLPFGIPKTDEERYQNINLEKYRGWPYVLTQKRDGSSMTAWVKGPTNKVAKYLARKYTFFNNLLVKTGITSRTMQISKSVDNNYTKVFKKYDLDRKLRTEYSITGADFALRGEMFGVGINTSKPNKDAALPELMFEVFDILDLQTMKLKPFLDVAHICSFSGIPCVMTTGVAPFLPTETIATAERIALDKGWEGVVVKLLSPDATETASFKVMNLQYDSEK